MIIILICLMTVTTLSMYGHHKRLNFFGETICPIISFLGFIGLLLYPLVAFNYFAAEHEANIINRECGTNYSQIEVFYAGGVIHTLHDLGRERAESDRVLMCQEQAEESRCTGGNHD